MLWPVALVDTLGLMIMASKRKNRLNNEKGLATIESIPILVIFLVLMSYCLGLFGYIHSGVLYSIGARTYAFETFANRAVLTYLRDDPGTTATHFAGINNRVHGIQSDEVTRPNGPITASVRPIAVGREVARSTASQTDHNSKVYEIGARNRGVEGGGVEVSPAWLMIGYGMCLNVNCGD